MSYFDAVALTQRHPDGHRDGTDAAEHVQQGETETLTELLGGSTGEAGAAPEGEAAWTTDDDKNKLNNNMKQSNTKNWKKKKKIRATNCKV